MENLENIKISKKTPDIYYSYFKMLFCDSTVIHLTEFEYMILSAIARDNKITSKDLSEVLGTTVHSVNNYKKKLKDKQLIVKSKGSSYYIINPGVIAHKLQDTDNYILHISYETKEN